MRHSLYLAFALALVAGNTQARADIVTYNMTGTLTDTAAYIYSAGQDGRAHTHNYSHPFAAGDHISWTLQYDRSTPAVPGSYDSRYEMQPNTPVLTNIVDQTTGYHFPVLPNSDTGSLLTLNRYPQPPGNYTHFAFEANQLSWHGAEFSNGSATQRAWLYLGTSNSLPAESLANVHLKSIPFAFGQPIIVPHQGIVASYFQFGTQKWTTQSLDVHSVDVSNFDAHVDSMTVSAASASTPEPGTLTLFLLGAAGLAARGMRRRLGQVG